MTHCKSVSLVQKAELDPVTNLKKKNAPGLKTYVTHV